MSNCCDRFVMLEGEEDSFETWQGLRGPYYTPHVDENGTLRWTNNGGLQNPEDVNIKGPPGSGGKPGGTTGQLLAKASDEDYDVEWIDPPEMDAGHVSYDSTETYSDGTVGKELGTINSALSSLSAVTEIIDTASGAIASFPDGSGLPMRSLLAQINPVQDLHGYDAPWAAGGGKNLLNLDFTNDSGTVAGMTFTHGESYITLKGTASGTSYATFNLRTPIPADLNTDYTYSLTISGTCPGGLYGIEFKNGTTLVQRFRCNTTDATSKTLQISSAFDSVTFNIEGLTSGLVFDCEIKIQFEKGSTKTTWQTYSNECPITGWTGLSGKRDGKNLLESVGEGNIDDTTGQSISGTNGVTDYIRIEGGTPITVSGLGTQNNNLRVYEYGLGKNFLRVYTATVGLPTYGTFTPTADAQYIRLKAARGKLVPDSDVQVELGSVATEFEEYTSLPITCTWQTEAGTVYDGTVDVVTGVLTVDTAVETENGGNPYWQLNTGGVGRFYLPSLPSGLDTSRKAESICNVLTYKDDNTVYGSFFVYGGSGLYVNKISADETLEQFKTRISNPALQIIYPLATPQTYQLTPQQISTLLGNNTVFVDTGDVSVTYQASIKGYIDKVLGA